MTDRRRNGFHGDPILVEKGPFCNTVSRSASSFKAAPVRQKASVGGRISHASKIKDQ